MVYKKPCIHGSAFISWEVSTPSQENGHACDSIITQTVTTRLSNYLCDLGIKGSNLDLTYSLD